MMSTLFFNLLSIGARAYKALFLYFCLKRNPYGSSIFFIFSAKSSDNFEKSNGFFGFCEDCKEYHLHFNNLFFSFNRTNLVNFRRYLEEIDLETSCIPEHDFVLKKNIVLKVLYPNIIILVDLEDLNMLKNLVMIKPNNNASLNFTNFPFEDNNN